MGQQAYLTLLALGRSPFEAPEQDENSNFVIDPCADDFSANGYVQQFDSRGHPQYPLSRDLERRIRRAKNDVLESAGAVMRRRKGIDTPKPLQTGPEWPLPLAVLFLDTGLRFGSLWWLQALRRRVQLYRTFDTIPLIEAVRSEVRIVGLREFLCAGLLTYVCYRGVDFVSRVIKHAVLIIKDTPRTRFSKRSEKFYRNQFKTARAGLRALLDFFGFHLQLVSTLESVHLLPTSVWSSASLVPFTRSSLVQMPAWPISVTSISQLIPSGGKFAGILLFGASYNILRTFIELCIERCIRRCTPQQRIPLPDCLDTLSLYSSKRMDLLDRVVLEDSKQLSLAGSIWVEIGKVQKWLLSHRVMLPLSLGRSGKRNPLPSHLESMLRLECFRVYHRRCRRSGGDVIYLDRNEREELARRTLDHVWSQQEYAGLGRLDSRVDVEVWVKDLAMEAIYMVDDASTATPEPEPEYLHNPDGTAIAGRTDRGTLLSIQAYAETVPAQSAPTQQGNEVASLDLVEAAEGISAVTTAGPRSSSDELLESSPVLFSTTLRSSEENHPEPEPSSSRDSQPIQAFGPTSSTPSPGITRAQSLESHRMDSRAPRELSERPDFSTSPPHQHRQRINEPRSYDFQRGTFLAALPSGMFATHIAALITTAILLPIESRFVRSLALGFLNSPAQRPGASAAATMIKGNVRGIGFGGNGNSLRYTKSMLLLLGLQGVISSGIWGLTTAISTGLLRPKGRPEG